MFDRKQRWRLQHIVETRLWDGGGNNERGAGGREAPVFFPGQRRLTFPVGGRATWPVLCCRPWVEVLAVCVASGMESWGSRWQSPPLSVGSPAGREHQPGFWVRTVRNRGPRRPAVALWPEWGIKLCCLKPWGWLSLEQCFTHTD